MEPWSLISILNALALTIVATSAGGRMGEPQTVDIVTKPACGLEATSLRDSVSVSTEETHRPDAPGDKSAEPQQDSPNNTPAKAEGPKPRVLYGLIADAYYSYGLNRSFTGKNALRYPEISAEHGPHLGAVTLWTQTPRTPVGLRLDVGYGTSVDLAHSREPSKSNVINHIEQAYLTANLDKKGTTYFDIGQWSSPAGVLSGNQPGWFYTDDWFLCFTVPIYHFGARVTHKFNETDYIMAGVHRGWDATGDPRHDPGLILSAGKALNHKLRLFGTYAGGNEHNGSGGESWRQVLNVLGIWNADKRWAYSAEADYGQQNGVTFAPGHNRDIHWYGASASAKYTLNAKQYVAGKAEWYREDSGFLTGFRGSMTCLAANVTQIVNAHLQLRSEYRHDFAVESQPFADRQFGKFTGQQGTFIMSAIVIY